MARLKLSRGGNIHNYIDINSNVSNLNHLEFEYIRIA